MPPRFWRNFPTPTPSLLKDQQRLSERLYWLATLEDRLDRVADAIVQFDRAAGLFRRSPTLSAARCGICGAVLSTCYHVIGRLRADAGHAGESLEPYRKAIALRKALSRDEPRNARPGTVIAQGSWHRLGEALQSLGQVDAAVKAFEKSNSHERGKSGGVAMGVALKK